jgi:hypothetical protein
VVILSAYSNEYDIVLFEHSLVNDKLLKRDFVGMDNYGSWALYDMENYNLEKNIGIKREDVFSDYDRTYLCIFEH